MEKYSNIIKKLENQILFKDDETKVCIGLNNKYFKLTINNREYYWESDTGNFDGTGTIVIPAGVNELEFPELKSLYLKN